MTLRLPAFLLFLTSVFAQTREFVPSDNLVVEGIPKIPASLTEDVSRYTKGRAAEILSWHPVKREMLIVTFFGNTPQVHQVKSPGAARTQLTFYDDKVGSGVSYQPKRGNYFVFSKDTGGDQNYQNYRHDFSTGAITLLTDGKSKNSPGAWSHAGDRQVYSSTRRTGKDVDFYVIDPSNPQSNRMLAPLEGGGWSPLDWSPDDRKVLAVEEISINESYLWLFDVASGEKLLLTPKGGSENISYSSGHFTRDGRGVDVITDKDSEFRRLALVDLATKQHRFLTDHIKWDVNEFEPSPDGKMIAFVTNEDGILALHLIDAITGKEKPLPGFPTGYVIGLHWHENGRDLGFTLDSARSADDAYSLDTKTGKVERWTFSETGGLNTDGFVDPEVIRWKGSDGRAISGFLYRPPPRDSRESAPRSSASMAGPKRSSNPTTWAGRTTISTNWEWL